MKSQIQESVQNSKNLILTVLLVLTSLFSFSQDTGKDIIVIIDNVKNDTGKVIMSLHSEATFMKSKGIMSAATEIKDGKVTITFENVEPGEYAVLAVHDENENKKMDFSDNGMPIESYGMSNNSMSFGPPQFGDAKFKLDKENLELNIRF